MRLLPRFAAGLSLVALLAAERRGGDACRPCGFVPDSADLLLEIKNPRRLVETVTSLDALKQLQQFPSVKELLDSTTSRRYYQFLAYFEKELGADRLELLDRLAGGGAVLATKFGGDPGPALLVVQGKDEKLMKKFADTALDVIEQELARQDVKDTAAEKTPIRASRRSTSARTSTPPSPAPACFVSNNEKALQAALDLYAGKSKKSMAEVAAVADAAKLLPADPLASLWINYETVKQQQAVKDFYDVRARHSGHDRLRHASRHALSVAVRLRRPVQGQGRPAVDRPDAARPRRHGRDQGDLPAAGRTAGLPAAADAQGRAVQRIVLHGPGALLDRTGQAVQRPADQSAGGGRQEFRQVPVRPAAEQAADGGRPLPPLRRRRAGIGRLQDHAETAHPGLRGRHRDARPGGVRPQPGDGPARGRPVRHARRSS